MFLDSFKITSAAMMQIFLLGAIGYFLMKKNILGEGGLDALSRLVVEVTLPLLIFCKLIKDFRFDLYVNWWFFPFLSLIITLLGFALGCLFLGFIKGSEQKRQFLSLITFQNSGYLPLVLIAALLPKEKADVMFIYLFLFLLGFNLIIWSFGVYLLRVQKNKKFELASLFSPPVIAIMLGLAVIFFGLNKFIPDVILKPLHMIGECTLPLALFVVGASLALIRLKQIDKKAVFLAVFLKLIILPALGFLLLIKCKFSGLLGLLIIMELAVPAATSLSVISRHYRKESLLINQGIFFGHILSLITLPLFLGLYFMLFMVK